MTTRKLHGPHLSLFGVGAFFAQPREDLSNQGKLPCELTSLNPKTNPAKRDQWPKALGSSLAVVHGRVALPCLQRRKDLVAPTRFRVKGTIATHHNMEI